MKELTKAEEMVLLTVMRLKDEAYGVGVECHNIVDKIMCHHIVDKVL